jgi:hypothetical protein
MKTYAICGLACLAVLASGTAMAADPPLPHMKLGLWNESGTTGPMSVKMQFCVDAATESQMSAFSAAARSSRNCEHDPIIHGADGSWTSTNTCDFHGAKRTTRAVITGDFNSRYSMVLSIQPSGKVESTMTAEWAGPCKPGQRGGDVIMSNGMKMNVLGAMAGPH